jgi:undecaprenyl-diphosphatase
MTILQSIILGLIQGLTEFLPVSSSGHLILVPYLFNWPQQELAFDVVLHFGTALAVLIFFYKDWIEMFFSLKNDLVGKKLNYDKLSDKTRLFINIILVSIPVALVGVLFEDKIEELFRNPLMTASMLIIVSFIMLFAEIIYKNKTHTSNISFIKSAVISFSQILALIPGTSRSGITISSGLFMGIERESVAKFSFLLATPLIIGATLVKIPYLFSSSNVQPHILFIGMLASFLSGFAAIKFLMKYLRLNTLKIFIVYRIFIGVIILYLVI